MANTQEIHAALDLIRAEIRKHRVPRHRLVLKLKYLDKQQEAMMLKHVSIVERYIFSNKGN